MNKIVSIISKIVLYATISVSVLIAVLLIVNGEASQDEAALADGSWTGSIINWSVLIAFVGVVLILLSYIYGTIIDPSSVSKDSGVVAGIVIFGIIFYHFSDGTPLDLPGYEGTENVSPWLNIADMGLYYLYSSAALAVIAIVASEIYRLFK